MRADLSKGTKASTIKYGTFQMQEYLRSDRMNKEEMEMLTNIRSSCVRGVKANFKGMHKVWDTLQGKGRSREEKLTPLPRLQFFLPTPTFALQCYRLISTIQLQGSGSVGKLPPAMRDSETVLKLTLC